MRSIIFLLVLHSLIVIGSVYSDHSYKFYSETYIRDLKLAKCIYNFENNKSIILGSSRSLMGYGIEDKVINYSLPGGGYIEATNLMSCISKDAKILFPLEYDRFDKNYQEYQHQSPIWVAYRNFGNVGGALAHLLNFGLSFDFLLGLVKRIFNISQPSFNQIGMGQGDLLRFNESKKYAADTWKIDMSLEINNEQLNRVINICKDERSVVFFHPMISYAKNSANEPTIFHENNELSLMDISSKILSLCKIHEDNAERGIKFYEPSFFYDYSHLKPNLGNKILKNMNFLD